MIFSRTILSFGDFCLANARLLVRFLMKANCSIFFNLEHSYDNAKFQNVSPEPILRLIFSLRKWMRDRFIEHLLL